MTGEDVKEEVELIEEGKQGVYELDCEAEPYPREIEVRITPSAQLQMTLEYLESTMSNHPPRCVPIVKRCLRALRERQ